MHHSPALDQHNTPVCGMKHASWAYHLIQHGWLPGTSGAPLVRVDFQNGLPSEPEWVPLDDRVMGGISQSGMRYDEALACACFEGHVTSDSNGGFASCRTKSWSGYGFQPLNPMLAYC